MPAVHTLELIPTDPGGPRRGDLLEIGDDGSLRVLRRSVLGRRVEASRPPGAVRAAAWGRPDGIAGLPWLTAGAQIAAQSAASPVGGAPARPLLAVSVPGEVTDETWLFAGTETAVATVARLLGGSAVARPDPGEAAGDEPRDGWGDAGDHGGAAGVPAPDGHSGDSSEEPVVIVHGPARRRRGPVAALLAAMSLLGVGIAVALVLAEEDIVREAVDRFVPTRPDAASPPGVPSLVTGFAPYRAVDLVFVWGDPSAGGAGLRGDTSRPPAPRGRTLGMGFTWRGRPFRVVVAPTPVAAARVRPPGTARSGNIVFRDGVPQAGRRALVAAVQRARRARPAGAR